MIRFNFMCPHTVDGPAARSNAGRDLVARCESSLPIQGDGGVVTSGAREANIKKCLRREIGTTELIE